MNDCQLRSFLLAARFGSFNKAAKRDHTTVQAFAARINALEQEVGVALFERDAKGVSLTEEGRDFLCTARDVIGLIDGGKERVMRMAKGKARVVRVGIAWRADPRLQEACLEFRKIEPDVVFEYVPTTTKTFLECLRGRKMDVASYPTLQDAETLLANGLVGTQYAFERLVCAFGDQSDLVSLDVVEPDRLRGKKVFCGFDYWSIPSMRFIGETFPDGSIESEWNLPETIIMRCLESGDYAVMLAEHADTLVCPPLQSRVIEKCQPLSMSMYYHVDATKVVRDFAEFYMARNGGA